ncbi:MAG: hypothetical protein ACXIUB_11880 [Wenzhouxiangella sp.]
MNFPLSMRHACAVAATLFFAAAVVAQSGPPTLILKTDNGDTLIELQGDVDLLPDRSIIAEPVDPQACAGAVSCEDVSVDDPNFRGSVLGGAASSSVTVNEGGNVDFSWRSRGAYDCIPGGDLPGWSGRTLGPDSAYETTTNRRVNLPAGSSENSPYTAELVCENGPVQSNDGLASIVSVTVNPPSGPGPIEGCENRGPPPGWSRMSTGNNSCVYSSGFQSSADCRIWNPGIWLADPANSAGITKRLVSNRNNPNSYIAIEFRTDDLSPTDQRRIETEGGGNPLASARRVYSISSCPGDFNQEAIEAETGCYGVVGVLSPIFYGGVDSGSTCRLESGRTYYLNIIATNSPLGTPADEIEPHPNCTNSTLCGAVYAPRNF